MQVGNHFILLQWINISWQSAVLSRQSAVGNRQSSVCGQGA